MSPSQFQPPAPIASTGQSPAGAAQATTEPVLHVLPRHPRQVAWAGVGLASTALGAIGAVVPGLPTTVFLIVASYSFTKSCPWLDNWLRRSRLFAPYARVLDPHYVMPPSARVRALGAMWLSVSGSLLMLQLSERLSPAGATCLIAAAAAGTVAILRFRRGRPGTA
ncbi:MAG: YbaN family protein [Acidobacteria bacterium]|nr:YbaN family protein [Acidobacteriota bacterium]